MKGKKFKPLKGTIIKSILPHLLQEMLVTTFPLIQTQ